MNSHVVLLGLHLHTPSPLAEDHNLSHISTYTCQGRTTKTCMFCYEIVNDRFHDAITPQELQVKKKALSLLEGMLKVTADERMSIKQVLKHEWLAEERAVDPDPGVYMLWFRVLIKPSPLLT